VAHAYNPNYPGGRDQEDCGLKPAYLKNIQKKRAGGVAQGGGTELKPQYCSPIPPRKDIYSLTALKARSLKLKC
jgi:hypothetical protein